MKISHKNTSGLTLVEIMIVVAIIGLLAAIAIPNFNKARQVISQTRACIANLKMIDGAKATWAIENKKVNTDTPATSDLYGASNYIRDEPACPGSGSYTLNAVDTKPTCSLHKDGHVLPDPSLSKQYVSEGMIKSPPPVSSEPPVLGSGYSLVSAAPEELVALKATGELGYIATEIPRLADSQNNGTDGGFALIKVTPKQWELLERIGVRLHHQGNVLDVKIPNDFGPVLMMSGNEKVFWVTFPDGRQGFLAATAKPPGAFWAAIATGKAHYPPAEKK